MGSERYAAVPAELTSAPRWVFWRYIDKQGQPKPSKVPYNPETGKAASPADPATWSTLEKAIEMDRKRRGRGGIGCGLGDGIAGVDLDGCRNPETGELASWAQVILDRLAGTYAEPSPSLTGIKFWARVSRPLPHSGKREGYAGPGTAIEVYDNRRYFTVTGLCLPGREGQLLDLTDELEQLCRELWPPEAPKTAPAVQLREIPQLNTADEREVLDRVRRSKAAFKFEALWIGNWKAAGFESQSSADLALCMKLAFFAGPGGRDVVDRLFRQSGLYREKWDRDDYRERTLNKAMDQREFYEPGRRSTAQNYAVERGRRKLGPDYPRTELGNAQMLIDRYGDRLRYVQTAKSWYVYDGKVWAQDTCHAGRLANQVALERLEEAEGDKDELKWAYSSQACAIRNGTLSQAATLAGVAIEESEFDTDPWLLNCPNGTLDLRTGQLGQHDPLHMITRMLPIRYDPDALCPIWDKFLDKIMAERKAMVGFLQRAVGYSLTGLTTEQVFFLLIGVGANGKSTLLEALQDLLGPYSRKADSETFLQGKKSPIREDLLDLEGARLVAVTEINEGRRLDEAIIKEFTGGDRVSTRGLYKDRVNLRINGKLWISANDRPDIRSGGHGMWRRMLCVPFTVVIPEDEKDRNLPLELAKERAGILAWAVRGCLEWQEKKGLQPPEDVRTATKDYELDQDQVGEWILDRCVLQPGLKTAASALYLNYEAWAGSDRLHRNAFFRRLAKRPGLTRTRTESERFWEGVGILTALTPPDGKPDGKKPCNGKPSDTNDTTYCTGCTKEDRFMKRSSMEKVFPLGSEPSAETLQTSPKPCNNAVLRPDTVVSFSPWGSCQDCGTALTSPHGGTHLCAACLAAATRRDSVL